jgi:hypothetical protein
MIFGIISFFIFLDSFRDKVKAIFKKAFYPFAVCIFVFALVSFVYILSAPIIKNKANLLDHNTAFIKQENSYIPAYQGSRAVGKEIVDFINKKDGPGPISIIGAGSYAIGSVYFYNHQTPSTYYWFISNFTGFENIWTLRNSDFSKKAYKYVLVDTAFFNDKITDKVLHNVMRNGYIWKNYKPVLLLNDTAHNSAKILFERKE